MAAGEHYDIMETIDYLGGKYEGELKNNLPHGKGILKWSSGDEYRGQWQNGKMTGLGIRIIGDGNGGAFSRMSGRFVDGEFQYPDWVEYDEL